MNFASVQNQLDSITDELAHATGPITSVVGQLSGGNSSLRYTFPVNLDGQYDVSVRVKARVQINEFQNISGILRITEDGGNGLNVVIPTGHHNYGHAHEAVLNFIRKGLTVGPGVNTLTFTTLVTGNNPPDVHFVEVENLTITDTSLVNANNVNPFIADWAEHGNSDAIPDGKLTAVRSWAHESAADTDTPAALEIGAFFPAEITAIPNGGEAAFYYRARVLRDQDGTVAYIGGTWSLAPQPAGLPLTWHTFVAGQEQAHNTYAAIIEGVPFAAGESVRGELVGFFTAGTGTSVRMALYYRVDVGAWVPFSGVTAGVDEPGQEPLVSQGVATPGVGVVDFGIRFFTGGSTLSFSFDAIFTKIGLVVPVVARSSFEAL